MKYGEELRVIRLGQKGYLEVIEKGLSSGSTVLLENIGESVDPVLDPLLGRNLIKKGRSVLFLHFYLCIPRFFILINCTTTEISGNKI